MKLIFLSVKIKNKVYKDKVIKLSDYLFKVVEDERHASRQSLRY